MLEEIKERAQTEGRRESRRGFYVGGQHNMVALSIKNSLAAATSDDHRLSPRDTDLQDYSRWLSGREIPFNNRNGLLRLLYHCCRNTGITTVLG